jgi:hypothetical protein
MGTFWVLVWTLAWAVFVAGAGHGPRQPGRPHTDTDDAERVSEDASTPAETCTGQGPSGAKKMKQNFPARSHW